MIIIQCIAIGVCLGIGISLGMAVVFAAQGEIGRFRRHQQKRKNK